LPPSSCFSRQTSPTGSSAVHVTTCRGRDARTYRHSRISLRATPVVCGLAQKRWAYDSAAECTVQSVSARRARSRWKSTCVLSAARAVSRRWSSPRGFSRKTCARASFNHRLDHDEMALRRAYGAPQITARLNPAARACAHCLFQRALYRVCTFGQRRSGSQDREAPSWLPISKAARIFAGPERGTGRAGR
jgi:hypothetical protein